MSATARFAAFAIAAMAFAMIAMPVLTQAARIVA